MDGGRNGFAGNRGFRGGSVGAGLKNRHRCRIRAIALSSRATQQYRDLLHDGSELRRDQSLEHAVADGFQVRQNHSETDQIATRRTHGQEDSDAPIFQPVFMTV